MHSENNNDNQKKQKSSSVNALQHHLHESPEQMTLDMFLSRPLNQAVEAVMPNIVALVERSLRRLEILMLQENLREKKEREEQLMNIDPMSLCQSASNPLIKYNTAKYDNLKMKYTQKHLVYNSNSPARGSRRGRDELADLQGIHRRQRKTPMIDWWMEKTREHQSVRNQS